MLVSVAHIQPHNFIYRVLIRSKCRPWAPHLHPHPSNALDLVDNMSSPLHKGSNKLASKRNRSQDSQRSLTPAPVLGASRNFEPNSGTHLPAFLRQSKAGKLLISKVYALNHMAEE